MVYRTPLSYTRSGELITGSMRTSTWPLLLLSFMSVSSIVLPHMATPRPRTISVPRHMPQVVAMLAHQPADDAEDQLCDELEMAARAAAAAVGGDETASVQFMMTGRMRARLLELGYSEADVDALDPQRAAAIIASGAPADPSYKPKRKRDRFALQFTCNICEGANTHSISKHAYTKGTVIVTCPHCNSTHLIADNLNWIEDDFKNLEDFMAKRGTPVTRVVNDGVAASAAAAAAALLPEDEDDDTQIARPTAKPIDGISEEQAARIREAIQASKRRRREEQG